MKKLWNIKIRIFPACSKSRQIVIDTSQSIVLLKGKVCLCLSSDYLQVSSFYSSPRCSVLILFQMVTTSNWHEIMNSVSHVQRLQVCILYKTRLPVSSKWFCRLGIHLINSDLPYTPYSIGNSCRVIFRIGIKLPRALRGCVLEVSHD